MLSSDVVTLLKITAIPNKENILTGRQILSIRSVVLNNRRPIAGSITRVVNRLRIRWWQPPLSDAHIKRSVVLTIGRWMIRPFRRRTRRFCSESFGDFRIGLPGVLRKSGATIPFPFCGGELLVGGLFRGLLCGRKRSSLNNATYWYGYY